MPSLTCPWIFISPTAAKFWVTLTHTVSCIYLLAVLQYCRRCAENIPYCTCKNGAENIPISHLGSQSASSCVWRMLEFSYTVPAGTCHWFMWKYGAISAQWNMTKQSEAPSITPWEHPACCTFDMHLLYLNNLHLSTGISISISRDRIWGVPKFWQPYSHWDSDYRPFSILKTPTNQKETINYSFFQCAHPQINGNSKTIYKGIWL